MGGLRGGEANERHKMSWNQSKIQTSIHLQSILYVVFFCIATKLSNESTSIINGLEVAVIKRIFHCSRCGVCLNNNKKRSNSSFEFSKLKTFQKVYTCALSSETKKEVEKSCVEQKQKTKMVKLLASKWLVICLIIAITFNCGCYCQPDGSDCPSSFTGMSAM